MEIRERGEDEIERQLPPEGWHIGICVDVLDAELKQGPTGGEYYSERIVFQLEDRKRDGTRYIIGRSLTLTPLPKGGATMSKKTKELLSTWVGKRNLEKISDTKQLIGKTANIQIAHQGGWANIVALDPAEKELEPEPYTRRTKEDRENWARQRAAGNGSSAKSDADVPF